MKTRFFLVLALTLLGCASDTIDNLTTITVGEGVLDPIQVQRSVDIGPTQLPDCVNANASAGSDAGQAQAQLQKTAAGCELSVEAQNVVIMDPATAQRVRDQSHGLDIDSVKGGNLEIQTLQLQNAQGAAIELGQYIASVSLALDGQVVLDHVNPSALDDASHNTLNLPDSVISELKDAVKNNQTATTAVAIDLVFTSAAMTSLPTGLNLQIVLQPELEISLIKAL